MDGTTTLLTAVTKSLVDLVFQTFQEMGNQDISTPIRQKVFELSRQYINNYRNRHGFVKVLGMSQPTSIESIYTKVKLLDAQTTRSFDTAETLETFYRQAKERSFKFRRNNQYSDFEVANQAKFLTVLGEPGSGKSTFLKKIGLEALKGKQGEFQHQCIPVFVELKQIDSLEGKKTNSEEKINIKDLDLVKELIIDEFRFCKFPDPDNFANYALSKGRLLVLLDGLDEVPEKYFSIVVNKIINFIDQYDDNRFIITCRRAAYRSYFKRCIDIVISDFEKNQIQRFIDRWFQSERDKQIGTAEQCWQVLQKPENAAALELAQTPLLLTFLCLVYGRSQRLPDNRSTLYRKALDILLEEWAAEKRIQQQSIYQGLHVELEKALLSELAYTKFSESRLFITKQEIIQQITFFLSQTLDAPQELLDGKAVLNAIEVQQGILVKRAEDVYSFSHLTIQEFLTARYISKNHKLIRNLLANNLISHHWREVILLVSGLQDSADGILLSMERYASVYINSPRYTKLLLLFSQISRNIQGEYNPSAKRTLAALATIVIAIKDKSKTSSNGTLNKDHFLYSAMNDALALIWTLDPRLAASFKHTGSSSSHSFLFSLVGEDHYDRIRKHIDYFTQQELKSLANYLTAILLITKCKKSAIRVSLKAWNSIEKRIFSNSFNNNSFAERIISRDMDSHHY